ncbi:MAG: Gfo/Idh/MocA family oxidoreductase [Armatimonadetes bacterium]|nr:Gfo/Idh/MocA family oxidoreductase [Armatimonadota bacterium]
MSVEKSGAGESRREFLRNAAVTTAVTAGVAGAAKSSVYSLSPASALGANDRIRVGHVGVGGQGMTHVRLLNENKADFNIQSVAMCDVYRRRIKGALASVELPETAGYEDYRKLLENKDIDVVWIATSDNWHAPVGVEAMLAGKHVYIEKPMCRTIEEAYKLWDTSKKTGKLVQVGSQGCSDQKWHVAGKIVKDGRIGHLIQAQGSYCRNGRDGEWNYYGIDKDAGPDATGDAYINWEMFRKGLGPKAFDPDRFFRWRKYWAYGNGIMGDLFPHRLHPLTIAMNLPQTGMAGFPTRASSMGGIYVQKINPVTKAIDREVPDFTTIQVDFAEECTLMLLGTTINEQGWQDMIRGNKASLYFGGSGVEIKPERVYAEEVEEATEPVPGEGERIEIHEKNLLDCIRGGGVPNCNIDLALRVQVMITLGEMAYRRGKTMHFDPKTRKYWG